VLAKHASEGTLLTIAIFSLIAGSDGPAILLIDELERGLHPRALRSLVNQLRKILDVRPDLQIVATSHSPYLADCFQADEILLTSRDDEGCAYVAPVVSHPDWDRWKEEMAPGEFWTTVGEDWVSKKHGGQP
jgi:predicted ATPase